MQLVKKSLCGSIYVMRHRTKVARYFISASAGTEFDHELADEQNLHVVNRKPSRLLQIFAGFLTSPAHGSVPG